MLAVVRDKRSEGLHIYAVVYQVYTCVERFPFLRGHICLLHFFFFRL